MQSLWEMKVGESGTVKWMMGNSAVMEFLRRHEIKEGNLIRVFQRGKSGVIAGTGNRRFAIAGEVAERIKI